VDTREAVERLPTIHRDDDMRAQFLQEKLRELAKKAASRVSSGAILRAVSSLMSRAAPRSPTVAFSVARRVRTMPPGL
jgi:hypothetical protein